KKETFLRPERTTSTPSSIFFRSSFPFIGDVSSDHCTRRIANANEEIITVTIKLSTQSIIELRSVTLINVQCRVRPVFFLLV
ncbi:unnamed protein product, partial [Tenebrio molitor]